MVASLPWSRVYTETGGVFIADEPMAMMTGCMVTAASNDHFSMLPAIYGGQRYHEHEDALVVVCVVVHVVENYKSRLPVEFPPHLLSLLIKHGASQVSQALPRRHSPSHLRSQRDIQP